MGRRDRCSIPDSIWDRLGIPPTDDAASIRQAYADKLKQVRPDDDPEGFRLLREAFDAARRSQAPARSGPRYHPPSDAIAAPPKPEPDPALLARDAVQAKLHVGWPLDAARAWRDHEARLTLADAERLQGAIAEALMANVRLDLSTLDEAVTLMRFEDAGRQIGAPTAVLDLLARRAAEAWWAELLAAGHTRFRWRIARQLRNRAARILLRRSPGPIRRRFPYIFWHHDLGYWLIAWPQHRRFLDKRLDADRLRWCQAAMHRWDARWVVRLWIAYLIATLVCAAITLALWVADLF